MRHLPATPPSLFYRTVRPLLCPGEPPVARVLREINRLHQALVALYLPRLRHPEYHHLPHHQQSEVEFILPTISLETIRIMSESALYRALRRSCGLGSTRSSVPTPGPSSTIVSPNLHDPRPPSSWLGWDPYQQQQQCHADLIISNWSLSYSEI